MVSATGGAGGGYQQWYYTCSTVGGTGFTNTMVFDPSGYRNDPRWLLRWKFYWAGFEATGTNLMRNGWKAEELQDIRCDSRQLILTHEQARVRFLSQQIDEMYWRDLQGHQCSGELGLNLTSCTQDITILSSEMPRITPVDISDTELNIHQAYWRLSQMSPFRSPIATEETKRIILPQEFSVDEMLAKIIEKQQPAQVEYFNKKVKENKMPEAKMTAQIIQLREAA